MTTPLNDESRLHDKLNEAFLYSVGGGHTEVISEDTDQLFGELSKISVPDSLDEWFSTLLTGGEKSERREKARRKASRFGKRAAIILVALSLVSVITAMSVDAVRIKVLNMFVQVQEKFSEIYIQEPDGDTVRFSELPANWDGYYPTVLPQGYVLKDSYAKGEFRYLEFKNSESKTIKFTQSPITVNTQLDTEGATVSDVEINGWDGLLIVEGDHSMIYWHNEDNVFLLEGFVSGSVLMEVAQSVIKK